MPAWSKIRKKLEQDYLADSLKGRITYFSTSYSYAPDHIGRAAIRLDGREILKSDYIHLHNLQWKSYKEISDNNEHSDISDVWAKSWIEAIKKGGFDNQWFYYSFNEYDNQSIEISLQSENTLVRIFAVLDRRVGKRRLKELSELWADEQEFLLLFLKIRMQAEGLNY